MAYNGIEKMRVEKTDSEKSADVMRENIAVNMAQPLSYIIPCVEYERCIDLVEAIAVCPVVYVSDPLKMANDTIDRMRGLVTRAANELMAARGGSNAAL